MVGNISDLISPSITKERLPLSDKAPNLKDNLGEGMIEAQFGGILEGSLLSEPTSLPVPRGKKGESGAEILNKPVLDLPGPIDGKSPKLEGSNTQIDVAGLISKEPSLLKRSHSIPVEQPKAQPVQVETALARKSQPTGPKVPSNLVSSVEKHQVMGSDAKVRQSSEAWDGVLKSLNGEVQTVRNSIEGPRKTSPLRRVGSPEVALMNTQKKVRVPEMSGSDFVNTVKKLKEEQSQVVLNPRLKNLETPVENVPKDIKADWALNAAPKPVQAPTVELAAPTVLGAGAKQRLTSVALMDISSGIQNLSHSQGGEIKIRLQPESLGEVVVKVKTDGNRVSLGMKAGKPEAKKILEDSIGYLKESLRTQNLILGKVDFGGLGVAHAAPTVTVDTNTAQSEFSQNSMFDNRQEGNRQNPFREQEENTSREWKLGSEIRDPGLRSRPEARVPLGRIDVRA